MSDFFLNNKYRFIVACICCYACTIGLLFAQDDNTGNDTAADQQTKNTKVYLEKSDAISFDQNRLPDVQIIKGNVRFRHDNALMYCDSAYFYSKESSFDAFGNVRIIEGDSIFIYGDLLFYNGNTKLARLRHNVRMENRDAVLTTDSLNYDRTRDLAYYYTGGKLADPQNTLTSIWGQYSPNINQALFKDSVHLDNESFTMDADTLKYNTETRVADIVGPTHIIYKDETDIYSTSGWYDTNSETSMLLKRSLIVNKDGKTVTGDTLYYDKANKKVEGLKNVEMADSIQKATLYGDYVFYDELTEYGFATDSALLVDWSSADSLYMHADSVILSKDSIYNIAQAFYNVRFFRNDMQGVCDSLVYLERDSVATMYGQPVVWSGGNQISGEKIIGYIKGEAVDRIFIPRNAMGVQPVENVREGSYNQFSGKEMTAYIIDDELKHIHISGNTASIFYVVEEGDSIIQSINKTVSSYIDVYLKDQKLERLKLTKENSDGTLHPTSELSGNDLFLNNFFWIEEQRPKQKSDVFLIFPNNRHDSNIKHSQSAAAAE